MIENNFEKFEENEIIAFYDDVLDGTNIAASDTGYSSEFWYVECDNGGYRGYFCKSSYHGWNWPVGYTFYETPSSYSCTWHCCSRYGGGRCTVIRQARSGYVDGSCGFWNKYLP